MRRGCQGFLQPERFDVIDDRRDVEAWDEGKQFRRQPKDDHHQCETICALQIQVALRQLVQAAPGQHAGPPADNETDHVEGDIRQRRGARQVFLQPLQDAGNEKRNHEPLSETSPLLGASMVSPSQKRPERQEENDVFQHIDQAERPTENELLRLREIPGQREERAIADQHQQQPDGDAVVATTGSRRTHLDFVRFHAGLSLMAEQMPMLAHRHNR